MKPVLPEQFIREMETLLGSEFPLYLDSYEKPRYFGLRVNTTKISVEDFQKISPFSLRKIPWTQDGFYISEEDKPSKHPYYYAGLYYLQEPSAMLPAEILPIEEGDKVLDLCAAPGGKSTKLACKIKDKATLYSNDISASRALALKKNLELFGAKRNAVLAEDPLKLSKKLPESFDKILIDAPCSGEGMFRKDAKVLKNYTEHGHEFYASLQKSILESALKLLKPGGLIVYSTCTFSVEEDEKILLYGKSICPGLEILPIPISCEGFMPGFSEIDGISDPELKNAIRLFPHKIEGEGHFAALLKKPIEGNVEVINETKFREKSCDRNIAFQKSVSSYTNLRALKKEDFDFLSKIDSFLRPFSFTMHENKLWAIPEDLYDFSGLHVLKNGLLVGESKSGRFEPSHALSLSLKSSDFPTVLSLSSDDERVLRYLKGETLSLRPDEHFPDGLILVAVDTFPLGFGKVMGTSIKNKYPAGWRYMA